MADLRVVDGAEQGPSAFERIRDQGRENPTPVFEQPPPSPVRREYAAELVALQELWDTLPDDVVRRQAVTVLKGAQLVIEALRLGRRTT